MALLLDHAADPGDRICARRILRSIRAPGELSLRGGCNLNRDVAELLRSADFRVVELERFALSGVPKTIGSHFVGSAVAA
jgi:hypothetical protein